MGIMCYMLLKYFNKERIYQPCYALVAQRLCISDGDCQGTFETYFRVLYPTMHQLRPPASSWQIQNLARFYAHLLATDAISWHVLDCLHLTPEQTTSSSQIFIRILFQELSNEVGIGHLNERLSDPAMQHSFESIFPKDSPRNARFAIGFFAVIGLYGLTVNLRQYLETMADSDSDSNSDTESIVLAHSDSESVVLDHSDSESD